MSSPRSSEPPVQDRDEGPFPEYVEKVKEPLHPLLSHALVSPQVQPPHLRLLQLVSLFVVSPLG